MSGERQTLDELKAVLADNTEALAVELLGEPSSRQGHQWRWGRNGSLALNIKGRWRGQWHSFEADQGGSLLDLHAFALGKPVPARGEDLNDAIAWAKNWLGWRDGEPRPVRSPPPPQPSVKALDEDTQDRQNRARQIWNKGRSVEGTPGEAYLRARGIKPESWPATVRWHAGRGELLFAKVLPDGSAITQIQSVCLNPDGSPVYWPAKDNKPPGKKKLTTGPGLYGAVRFDGDNRALCLAEGPETALSIWQATGIETWAALGQVKQISLVHVPLDRPIVICRDDDARNAPSRKTTRDAIRAWRREGRTVVEALPWKRARRDKSDFNDTLVEAGPEAIAERIESALTPMVLARDSLPVRCARQRLSNAMQRVADELWDKRKDKPARALRVGLGVGKTQAALEIARDWIAAGLGVVIFAVPEHRLGENVRKRAQAILPRGSRVAVWRGRAAINPATDKSMCDDLDAIEAVRRVSDGVQFLVCHNGEAGPGERKCQYYETCAYQRQRRIAAQADLIIIAHALLFTNKPRGVPGPSLVIVDEDLGETGLAGTNWNSPVLVTANDIDRMPLAPRRGRHAEGWSDNVSAELADELTPVRRKLRAAFDNSLPGYLTRQTVLDAGLTAEECTRAIQLEWKRWREPPVWPGMTMERRLDVLKKFEDRSDVPRLARLWRILADLLADEDLSVSGRVEMVEQTDEKTRSTYWAFRLQWRRGVALGWSAPTLIMSATLRLELVRPYFPAIELASEPIEASTPHQVVTYHHGKSFSHSNLHALQSQQGKALPKGAKNLRRAIWVHAMALHRANGGETLLIVPQVVEKWLKKNFTLPAGMHLAHHGAVAGRDEWKSVRTLIVVGRPMPNPEAVERLAGALTGAAATTATGGDGWFAAEMRTLADKAGKKISVEVDTAGEGIAEQIRASITEDQIEQAIGRGRGVNRTENDPLDVHLFGTGPIEGVEIDHLVEWQAPDKEAAFVALKGVWLENIANMATAIGVTAKTLEHSRARARTAGQQIPPLSYSNFLYGNGGIWSRVRYRRQLERHGWQEARFAPGAVDDPKAWLEALLGPVEVEIHEAEPVEPGAEVADEAGLTVDPAEERSPGPLHLAAADGPAQEHGRSEKPELPPDWRPRLAAIRSEQCWSQEELAQHIGLARSTFSHFYGGRRGLSDEALERLVALLASPPPARQTELDL